jgi:hypothetical protein
MIGELRLENAAKEAAGNWRDFDCFWWRRADNLPDADKWGIFYTHNRDSGLLDQSNADYITTALQPFAKGGNPDVVFESHSHWAVGHVDGFSIRVFKRGRITRAFKAYHKLAQRMANYPILDEDDYCERELDATLENIPIVAWKLKDQYDLPDNWVGQVYRWFADHDCTAIENVDDQGGYPSEDQLREAFCALGYRELAAA